MKDLTRKGAVIQGPSALTQITAQPSVSGALEEIDDLLGGEP
ncbi:MAG TPA: hypothetical protein VJP02_00760 [Candidatus Sulfotelmatobacter sp.]|nr:hypothetical protein [Candidatus Sulfotelmatobacter sp.]